jgi:hypothetical protein
MSKQDEISRLISQCLDRCRASGFTLTTLIQFLDELRKNGHPETDVQMVENAVRRIMTDIRAPGRLDGEEEVHRPT